MNQTEPPGKCLRGSSKIKVRNDDALAAAARNDKMQIYMTSNQHGIEPTDFYKRWFKKNKKTKHSKALQC